VGAYGYQRELLRPGYSGDGSMLTAGLPARGGGPTTTENQGPRALAPNEIIGSPHSDATERVLVDPETGATKTYSHRKRW
jgi:hypothetical protein